MELITSPSDNENFSADSLEENAEGCSKTKKNKKLKKLSHHHKRRRKTYLELYQSRLAFEFLKYRHDDADAEGANDNETSELRENEKICESVEKVNVARKRSSLWSEYLARKYKQQYALSQANSKTEMLRRRTDYGCRMSSMNRVNRLCRDLHDKTRRQHHNSSSSLFNNDNGCNENAKTSKMMMISTQRMGKNSKDSSTHETHEMKERSEKLQLKLEQMQIRHCFDRKKVEKIQNSVM